MNDKDKAWQILKYGKYLPHRLDIDLTTINIEDRMICSASHPSGIYTNLAEYVETELGIPIQEYCDNTDTDLKEATWGNNL